MSDEAGMYVCTGGFVISGMLVGSAWGGTAGATAGGVGAVPGAAIGALGGALWAAAICTRPAVKRFIQNRIDKPIDDFDKAIDVSSLKSELRTFVQESSPAIASKPDAAVAFMLEYLQKNGSEVFSLADSGKEGVIAMLSADAKQGMEVLKTAKSLTKSA